MNYICLGMGLILAYDSGKDFADLILHKKLSNLIAGTLKLIFGLGFMLLAGKV